MTTTDQTIAGVKTFSSSPIVPDPTTDSQAATKKYVDDNAGGGGLLYKVYTALLNQSGTDAPVEVRVHENTIGSIVWSRASTGNYIATFNDFQTIDGQTIIVSVLCNNVSSIYRGGGWDTNAGFLLTQSVFGAGGEDDLLVGANVEIRVYP